MKTLIVGTALVGLLVLLVVVVGPLSQPKPAQVIDEATEIVLTTEGYEPSTITIRVGTEVTFSSELTHPHWPASNLHPSHEIYPEFDPVRPIPANETWSFVFDQVGSYNYHDHIRAYYTGVIHVVK